MLSAALWSEDIGSLSVWLMLSHNSRCSIDEKHLCRRNREVQMTFMRRNSRPTVFRRCLNTVSDSAQRSHPLANRSRSNISRIVGIWIMFVLSSSSSSSSPSPSLFQAVWPIKTRNSRFLTIETVLWYYGYDLIHAEMLWCAMCILVSSLYSI